MSKIFAIASKELKSYFGSFLPYLVFILTVSTFNIFFYIIIDDNQEATLRDIFKVMEFLFVFLVPLITMKSFSEENALGTMEFLLTTPTRPSQIVWGKFLGSYVFFVMMASVTLVYYGITAFFGKGDFGASAVGFIGILLEGALFIAIGLWASSLTRSQTVAAMVSYLVLFLLYFSMALTKYAGVLGEKIIHQFGTFSHLDNMSSGLVNVSDIAYYISVIILCLLWTHWNIDKRLWR